MNKFYAMAALAALPLCALARPASPELMQHVNPDGSVVEYNLMGDEHFNYMLSADGETILEFNADNALVPSAAATETNLASLRAKNQKRFVPERRDANIFRMAELDMSGRSTYPTVGDVPALVILLEYADVPFSSADPKKQYERFCNEKGYSDYGGRGSAKDYFEATSNGKFSPNFEVYGPVKLEHNAAWYVGDDDSSLPGYQHNARFGVAIQEALTALDKEIDFSRYDLDKDGNIDSIFFFFSGYGQADTGNKQTVWPHQWDFLNYTDAYDGTIGLPRLKVDGVEMRAYACSNELNGSKDIPAAKKPYLDGIGAFCHEYGHVLGLPDLYNTTKKITTKSPGRYTVMADGSYNGGSTCPPLFSAYEQWVCHWLDYTDATDGTEYTLHPFSNTENHEAVRIRIRRAGGTYQPEYYLIECRDDQGWDAELPKHGMFIWRINYNSSIWKSNQVNSTGTPYVELITHADNSVGYTWPGENVNNSFIIPGSKVLVPQTTKTELTCRISRMTYQTDENGKHFATFAYNKDEQTDAVTTLSSDMTVNSEKHEVYLKWDAEPTAINYAVTVYYRDEKGTIKYVDGLNDVLVGNRTSYTITGIKADGWDKTYTASVRCYNGIASKKTSNSVTFQPQRLPEGSGVNEIGADNAPLIIGGIGCVYAPEGSRVYNLNGVETSTTGLPAGIYIVVAPNSTAKVVVK